MRIIFVVFWIVVASLGVTVQPVMARSLALIVGNDTYLAVGKLQKARGDARSYAQLFETRGFAVTLALDLDRKTMGRTLAVFYDSIRPGDTVVFIYSGHGWSDGRENFIIPTDTEKASSEAQLKQDTIPLGNGANGILDEIRKRGPMLSVMVIDACRSNPFVLANGTRAIGLSRGLSTITAPEGTFIAFSAGAGQEALDWLTTPDPDPNSVFARYFLDQLALPQDLQMAFKATQVAVNDAALSIGREQLPAYYDATIGFICLLGNCEDEPVAVVQSPEPTPPKLEPDIKVSGITLRDLPADAPEKVAAQNLSDQGVLVYGLDQNSEAYANGLREGDIIIAASGRAMHHPSDFRLIVDAMTKIQTSHLLLFAKRKTSLKLFTLPLSTPAQAPKLRPMKSIAPELREALSGLADWRSEAPQRLFWRLRLENLFKSGVGVNVTNRIIVGTIKAQTLMDDLASPLALNGEGIIVTEAPASRPYENALQVGDVVTRIGYLPVTGPQGFEVSIKALKPDAVERLEVYRIGRVEVLFIKRQSDGSYIFPRDATDDTTPAARPTSAAVVSTVPQIGDLARLGFTVASPRTFTGAVITEARVADFSVSEVQMVTARLSGLVDDIDLVLADGNGRVVGKSSNSGSEDEQVSLKLSPGNYSVRLLPLNKRSVTYRLDIYSIGEPAKADLAQYGSKVGSYGDWDVYRNDAQRCFMVTKALTIKPEYGVISIVPVFEIGVDPGSASIFISMFFDSGDVDKGSVKLTVRDAAGNHASLPVNFDSNRLVPLTNKGEEVYIDIADMKKIQASEKLEVSGLDHAGNPFSFEYSLTGYTKAARAINVLCDANAYWILGQ